MTPDPASPEMEPCPWHLIDGLIAACGGNPRHQDRGAHRSNIAAEIEAAWSRRALAPQADALDVLTDRYTHDIVRAVRWSMEHGEGDTLAAQRVASVIRNLRETDSETRAVERHDAVTGEDGSATLTHKQWCLLGRIFNECEYLHVDEWRAINEWLKVQIAASHAKTPRALRSLSARNIRARLLAARDLHACHGAGHIARRRWMEVRRLDTGPILVRAVAPSRGQTSATGETSMGSPAMTLREWIIKHWRDAPPAFALWCLRSMLLPIQIVCLCIVVAFAAHSCGAKP